MSRILAFASVAALFCSSAAGASQAYVFSPDGKGVVTTPIAGFVKSGVAPKSRGSIVNYFASKYPDGLYWCCFGIPVAGPSSGPGAFSSAVAFTPAATKSATKITVGVGYISGTNSITVSLYSDNGGVPGTELASGTVSNLAPNGACCGTGTAKIPATTVTAGTQYWIVLSASGNTFESWNSASADQVHAHTVADDVNNAGWHAYSSIEYPVVQVR